jgi:ketosteroid isomerase-like protein
MTARTPDEFPACFAEAFSSGDLNQVLSCYWPDAVLVDREGYEHHGIQAIALVLRPLLMLRASMSIKPRFVIQQGATALLRNDFSVLQGGKVVFESSSVEVIGRDGDGLWKLLLDHPYGGNASI